MQTATKTKTQIEYPSMYGVIFYNDDITPIEFVVYLIKNIFHKSDEQAMKLTLDIHHNGQAIIEVYSKEIAKEKMKECNREIAKTPYPLKVRIVEI